MKKLRISERWRVVSIVTVICIAGCALIYFGSKTFMSWLDGKFPQAIAVRDVLRERYPDSAVDFNDTTQHGDTKQRILTVTINGKDVIRKQELQRLKAPVCQELAKQSRIYDRIELRSQVENRAGVFYAKRGESTSFSC